MDLGGSSEPRQRGHISREFTVRCGQCDAWEQDLAGPTIADAKKVFRSDGWTWTLRDGWRCPEHSK